MNLHQWSTFAKIYFFRVVLIWSINLCIYIGDQVSINTLNQCSQSTLHWHLGWHSIKLDWVCGCPSPGKDLLFSSGPNLEQKPLYLHWWSSVNQYPQSMLSINTPLTPRLTLNWNWLTLDQHSINFFVNSRWTFSHESTNCWSMRVSWLTLSWLLANCWSSVSSVNQDIDQVLTPVLIGMSIEW